MTEPPATKTSLWQGTRRGALAGLAGGFVVGLSILGYSLIRLKTNSRVGGENIELGAWVSLFVGFPFSLALQPVLEFLSLGMLTFIVVAPLPNGVVLGALAGLSQAVVRRRRGRAAV